MRSGDLQLKPIPSIQPGLVRPLEWIKPARLILLIGKRLRRCMVATVLISWSGELYLKVEEEKTLADDLRRLPPGVYFDVRAGAQLQGFEGRTLRPGIVDLPSILRLCRDKRLSGHSKRAWHCLRKLLMALITLYPWMQEGSYEMIHCPRIVNLETEGTDHSGNESRLIRRPDYVAGGLSKGEEEKLEAVAASWTARAVRTRSIDREVLIPAINNLYHTFGLPSPPIAIVRSPFALAVVGSFAVKWWHDKCEPSDALIGEDIYGSSVDTAFHAIVDFIDSDTRRLIENSLDKPAGRSMRRSYEGIAGGVIDNALTDASEVFSCRKEMDDSIIQTLSDLLCQDSKSVRKLVHSNPGHCRQLLKIQNTQLFGEFLTTAVTDVFGLTLADGCKLNAWQDVANNCGPILLHEKFCLVSDFPEIAVTYRQDRPHSDRQPSCLYRDGWALYHWHGVRVPERVIEEPETITVADIKREGNLEVRRAMVEVYGPKRFLIDCHAREIHRDECGVLYLEEIHPSLDPLVMVKVVNASREPDGSFKDYFIRVPPHISTAKSAVAWTFGVSADEYMPLKQT